MDALGANEGATIVMAILEAISSAHENLAKILELLPKLLLSVSAFPFVFQQGCRAGSEVLQVRALAEMCCKCLLVCVCRRPRKLA